MRNLQENDIPYLLNYDGSIWFLARALHSHLKKRRGLLTPCHSYAMLEIPEIDILLPFIGLVLLFFCQVEWTSLSTTRKKDLFYTDVQSILEHVEKNSMSGFLKVFLFLYRLQGRTPWLSPEVIRTFWWEVYPLFYRTTFKEKAFARGLLWL